MNISLREQATKLRQAGWSYNIIAERLGLAKSTLSNWLREVPYKPNSAVVRRILAGPAKSAELKQARKLHAIRTTHQRAATELGKITDRDLWMLGLGIYLGEGSKLYEITRVTNSDPDILRVSVEWFKKICRVPLKNFAIRLHVYPDTDVRAATEYWQNVTGIPASQFQMVSLDKRTNKAARSRRKLPFGTAHITIRSLGLPEHGVALHRRILGWINEVMRQARV